MNHFSWTQVSRRTRHDFFDLKPGEELTPEMRQRAPDDLGEEFRYHLLGPNVDVDFSQNYYLSDPLHTLQTLSFYFGEGTTNPNGLFDNSLGHHDLFAHLKHAKMRFMASQYNTGERYVTFESQNLGLHVDGGGFGQSNRFTNRGTRFMEAFVSSLDQWKSIPGMQPEDKRIFSDVLDLIGSKYATDDIEPENWFYT